MAEGLGSDAESASAALDDARQQDELRAWVRQSAADTPQFPVFLQRLIEHGMRLDATVSRSGRVTGLGYVWSGGTVKASTLGPEFTWSGLQKKFGVYFVPQRDRVLLEAHIAGEPLPSADESALSPEQEALPFSAPGPAPGEPAAAPTLSEEVPSAAAEPPAAAMVPSVALAVMAETDTAGEETAARSSDSVPLAGSAGAGARSDAASLEAALAGLMNRVEQLQAQLRQRDNQVEHELQRLSTQVAALGASIPEASSLPAGRDEALASNIAQAQMSMQEARDAVLRSRQDALWLTATGGAVAGLIIALLLGLWISQSVEESSAQARDAVIEHMDKQVAEDPLRKYFDRIVKKLQ